MKGMEKISDAILSKVKAEADTIINEAREKAATELKKAEEQRQLQFEEQQRRTLAEAEREAARIMAEASVKARQELSQAKAEIVDQIIGRVKKGLAHISTDQSLPRLIKEAVAGIDSDQIRILVAAKDIAAARDYIKHQGQLASKIVEVKEVDCSGGVIAEKIDGSLRIDNTSGTRLDALMPQMLPQINQQLFTGV